MHLVRPVVNFRPAVTRSGDKNIRWGIKRGLRGMSQFEIDHHGSAMDQIPASELGPILVEAAKQE